MEVRVEARDAREATVTANGNGAHVTVPKEWLGQEVIVLRPVRKP